jgi:quercetin dioxygenase-like cupin family protein
MKKLFSTSAALLSLAAMPVVGIAQTGSTQISITPTSSQKVIAGAPGRFTGTVRIQSLFDAKEPSRSSGGQVTFQPGARSAWHTHPFGQVLIVTDGVGWVQRWTGWKRSLTSNIGLRNERQRYLTEALKGEGLCRMSS